MNKEDVGRILAALVDFQWDVETRKSALRMLFGEERPEMTSDLVNIVSEYILPVQTCRDIQSLLSKVEGRRSDWEEALRYDPNRERREWLSIAIPCVFVGVCGYIVYRKVFDDSSSVFS